MFNTIEIYKEKLNNYSEIRIILFYRISIDDIDTTILPYPTLNFEHPKLIKPFLKEKNLLKRLEKKLIKGDIFDISWALAKIGIATFVNITPSSEYVDNAFITFPKRLTTTQINAINRLTPIFLEYSTIECNKVLDDNSIFPIEEIKDGKTLINYINKEKEKILIKKRDNYV